MSKSQINKGKNEVEKITYDEVYSLIREETAENSEKSKEQIPLYLSYELHLKR